MGVCSVRWRIFAGMTIRHVFVCFFISYACFVSVLLLQCQQVENFNKHQGVLNWGQDQSYNVGEYQRC